ncbi:hypothetical protein EV702DRAFT_1049447 [Suillus placidus]|uniref:Uncharacterized protein n=1 Tax=Suillus placidus TaxID=48579 RepID=A0A9P6ZL97_9AGAM|nr:hypothetical protein EV702DRAFT_1049447 [Suillus placidus]
MQPAPTSAPPTTTPATAAPTTLTARLGNLFSWRCDHPGPPVVDVPFVQGKERNAAEGPKNVDDDLIRDEDYHGPPTPDPNLQQQQQAVTIMTTSFASSESRYLLTSSGDNALLKFIDILNSSCTDDDQ